MTARFWFRIAAPALFGVILLRAQYPGFQEGDYTISSFRFQSGETLENVRLHYVTLGTPKRNDRGVVTNAVLIVHGTGGSSQQFLRAPHFHAELFGAGQPLDASRYFIVLPDCIGHGQSSKPSDGLRTRFPHYGYQDMVELEKRLLEDGLGVTHLRLMMGTSMGCMHSWVWLTEHPGYADGAMPLACLPYPITGRNLLWRQMAMDLIRTDPAYQDGNYASQPAAMKAVRDIQLLIGRNPQQLQKQGSTRADALRLFAGLNGAAVTADANDSLYWLDASRDYDPSGRLDQIAVPVVAINFTDDPINPPELGIFRRETAKVRGIRAIEMQGTPDTFGHSSHTHAELWKRYLADLLTSLE